MGKFVLAAFGDEAGSVLDEQIGALLRNGIGHLEIRGVDGKSIGDIGVKEAGKIAAKLKENGLSVRSVGSPFGKQDITGPFGPHLDKFRRCLDTANALGAGYMRIFSFFIPDGSHERYFGEVTQRLSRFCAEAEKAGITLCHENEKGIYGDVPERCLEIHKALPGLRAVFDPANFIQCGADTLRAWSMLKPYVEYIHVKDARPDGTVVPAGYGIGNVKAIVSDFGSGMLTLEPHLAVFEGLGNLEKDGGAASVDASRFPTQRAAFDFAAEALRNIIKEETV